MTTRPSLLVIDDEPAIRSIIRAAVEDDGGVAFEAANAATGLELARRERPALIVLDLGLPDQDGVDVCRSLREWSSVPILVLSARHSDAEKARALDAGADDYLTKPFSTIELQARLRAMLRRARMAPVPGGDAPLVRDGVVIDLANRQVTQHGMPVHLTPTEWELLRALVTHAGRTMTHKQLFDAVWGRHHGDAQQYLRVYIGHLRRKLETDPLRPTLIVTEGGVGYRFADGH
ncbi:MAG TPA: response regulator [Gemmatimonas sp.]|uniref:response regulator n=1 Tax=Gemmatimonas sp. TaxID=1962908 RepID=UPI002ED8D72A